MKKLVVFFTFAGIGLFASTPVNAPSADVIRLIKTHDFYSCAAQCGHDHPGFTAAFTACVDACYRNNP